MRATYSPEDNKLRLYPDSRLDPDDYARVKAAGFSWAPKQDLFVAPAWSPEREDLLLTFVDEIEDEDTSLVDRAADRAERFEDYSEKRAAESQAAADQVEAIAGAIPLGQPILVGHHSEKHAQRDAEKITAGMHRVVNLWKTAEYWERRAQGAIRAAKYKELPSVRARRIKKLEAELRKLQKNDDNATLMLAYWTGEKSLTRKDGAEISPLEQALFLANAGHIYKKFPLDKYPRTEHTYEGDMSLWSALNDGIIGPEEAAEIAIRVYSAGIESRARWISHLTMRIGYEKAMLQEAGGTVADRTKPEKGGGCRCWASPRGGWSYIVKVNQVTVSVLDNWGNGGKNFRRTIPFDKLSNVMTAAEVASAKVLGRIVEDPTGCGFFLTGEPTKPTKTLEPPKAPPAPVQAIQKALDLGVSQVVAPQLFPTPPEIVERMLDLAELKPGLFILEPSAGTGNIIRAVLDRCDAEMYAYEINRDLCQSLIAEFPAHRVQVREKDFLTVSEFKGFYSRAIMNPPFRCGDDIKHIRHALDMLAPGGILVAICAGGPRQAEAFQSMAEVWEPLPAGSFAHAGTNVNTVLLKIRK